MAPKKPARKAKPAAKPKPAQAKPAPVKPAKVVAMPVKAAPKPAARPERAAINIPPPDFGKLAENLKAYANKNPAALVVGIIAILMVWVLLVD